MALAAALLPSAASAAEPADGGSEASAPCCGDGICNGADTCASCPQDCTCASADGGDAGDAQAPVPDAEIGVTDSGPCACHCPSEPASTPKSATLELPVSFTKEICGFFGGKSGYEAKVKYKTEDQSPVCEEKSSGATCKSSGSGAVDVELTHYLCGNSDQVAVALSVSEATEYCVDCNPLTCAYACNPEKRCTKGKGAGEVKYTRGWWFGARTSTKVDNGWLHPAASATLSCGANLKLGGSVGGVTENVSNHDFCGSCPDCNKTKVTFAAEGEANAGCAGTVALGSWTKDWGCAPGAQACLAARARFELGLGVQSGECGFDFCGDAKVSASGKGQFPRLCLQLGWFKVEAQVGAELATEASASSCGAAPSPKLEVKPTLRVVAAKGDCNKLSKEPQ